MIESPFLSFYEKFGVPPQVANCGRVDSEGAHTSSPSRTSESSSSYSKIRASKLARPKARKGCKDFISQVGTGSRTADCASDRSPGLQKRSREDLEGVPRSRCHMCTVLRVPVCPLGIVSLICAKAYNENLKHDG